MRKAVARLKEQSVAASTQGERQLRTRQRLRLIEACISALHQYGPSRTTVDKVVAIADMSPGIVNFYFDTKAALLVAALEHLAIEFEESVLMPIEALRQTPGQALDLLIALYLDPIVASPRKVSVWYSFWGEASARAEYQAICGKRDVAFFELVRGLVEGLAAEHGDARIDADAVSLGLVGALEMIWQDIAFREEAEIDRPYAQERCRSYLRSIFPPVKTPLPPLREREGPTAKRWEGEGRAAAPPPRQADEACTLLVAAELAFAGMNVLRTPDHWPGYDLLAQPPGRAPQTIRVRPSRSITYGEKDRFDWLAIVDEDTKPRVIYLVPRKEADRERKRRGASGSAIFSSYVGNFALLTRTS